MNIEDLTIGQAKELSQLLHGSSSEHPFEVGKNYFIRTVTMIQIGKLVKVMDKELVLENAVWVADTGRFTQALADGTVSEVELFPAGGQVIIGRGSLIDACVWLKDIPKEQK